MPKIPYVKAKKKFKKINSLDHKELILMNTTLECHSINYKQETYVKINMLKSNVSVASQITLTVVMVKFFSNGK